MLVLHVVTLRFFTDHTHRDKTRGDLLTAYNGTAITYDGIGNPNGYSDRTFTWEHGRQMATQTKGGVEWEYTYNNAGLRTKRSSDSKTYEYVYSGDKLVQMTITDHTTNPETVQFMEFSYDAAGQPLTMELDGTLYYYVLNIQGDVTGLVDGSGNLMLFLYYEGYGRGFATTSTSDMVTTLSNTNPLGYRGYVMDVGTAMYYLQSRYYDPILGRFLNADVFASTGQGLLGYNTFAYCNNNPTNHEDPFGYYLQKYATRAAFDNYAYSIIKHDVPLYYQGDLNLCWAYCQIMLEDYQSGIVSTQEEADKRAKELAISVHGEFNILGKEKWNKGAWPTNRGDSVQITGILQLYDLLKDGPVYAYYWNGKRKGKAHLVVVTGVDVYKGLVYTNNPWNYPGVQTYEEFLKGVFGGPDNDDRPLNSIILIN